MNKKNGFTLIELLAVIVVLAIIMVIATTRVTRVIEKTRVNAFISTYDVIVRDVKNKLSLGDDIASITCDDDTTNKCSSKYDISEKDYKLKISKTNNEIYVILIPKVGGKFNDINLENADYSEKYGVFSGNTNDKNKSSLITKFDLSNTENNEIDVEKDIINSMHFTGLDEKIHLLEEGTVSRSEPNKRNRALFKGYFCPISEDEEYDLYNVYIYKDATIDNNNMILPKEYTIANLLTILKNDKNLKYMSDSSVDKNACYDIVNNIIYKCYKDDVEININENSSYVKDHCYGYSNN